MLYVNLLYLCNICVKIEYGVNMYDKNVQNISNKISKTFKIISLTAPLQKFLKRPRLKVVSNRHKQLKKTIDERIILVFTRNNSKSSES